MRTGGQDADSTRKGFRPLRPATTSDSSRKLEFGKSSGVGDPEEVRTTKDGSESGTTGVGVFPVHLDMSHC